jgi:hypothetical protein
MMNPIAVSPVLSIKKLPLQGAFRDRNNCSRDACGDCREYQLSVSQHAERDAAQLTECLGSERERRREEPGSTERAGPAERGAHPRRDSERDEP